MTARLLPPAPESPTGLQQQWKYDEEVDIDADIVPRQRSSIAQPPLGFPEFIDGPKNWSGCEPGRNRGQILTLSNANICEICNGLHTFNGRELDGDEVRRELFRVPTLEGHLKQATIAILNGSGIFIIRGLRWEDYSIEDRIVIFLGLASHIGDQRGVQNSKGDMLSHIIESKAWTVPKEKRHGIHTSDRLPFHNDMGCEILSMQIRDRADAGGHTCVASMTAIYNDLRQSNPWVLHVLAKPNWPIQTSSKKDPPFVLCPLMEYHDDNLVISMDPARIGPHPLARYGSIPDLTPGQEEALAVLQRTAEKHQMKLETQPGDIVFINNLSLLHARESYEDGTSSSRHLVRLWLRNTELGWRIPPAMKMPWDAAFGDRAAKVVNRHYPIMPMPEYMECKYSNGTAAFVADDNFSDSSSDEVVTKVGEDG
ncbi:Clavaminate synthase-like protein [Hypoxylon trugodes]|uniref:Clavaminate synthase-like protein n=1 Tax=Hypoxylon trugodes TaxID=326681 RepID=UPI00219EA528|nr:Clavaminate synthase-like protein [Hypoxylon trugodes]KAI1390457.1 Clavaminate synthase-like protein [Hypoxylon trugodes]